MVVLRKFCWGFVGLLAVQGCSPGSDEVALDKQLAEVIQAQGLTGQPVSRKPIPAPDEPLVQLGKKLFFSTSLSGNGDVACVSCHHPALGGGDQLSLPIGIDATLPELLGPGRRVDSAKVQTHSNSQDPGPNVPRNSPSTFNTNYYQNALFWDGRVRFGVDESGATRYDGGIVTPDSLFATTDSAASDDLLFAQSRFPVTSGQEMLGFAKAHYHNDDVRAEIERKLRAAPVWLAEFRQAFAQPKASAQDLLSFSHLSAALAAYQRSQDFVNTPWRDYVSGRLSALSEQQKQGALLFFQGKPGAAHSCASCHRGDFFTDERYYNLALPQFGPGKDKLKNDYGRKRVTRRPEDKFRFRTPTLLNTTETGPYGHNGAYATLKGILKHHVDAAQAIADYDYDLQHLPQYRDFPVTHPYIESNTRYALEQAQKTADLPQLLYSDDELDKIEAFLHALTDPCTQQADCLQAWLPDTAQGSSDAEAMQLLKVRLATDTAAADATPKQQPGSGSAARADSPAQPLFIERASAAGIVHTFKPSRPDLPLDAKPNDPGITRLLTSNMHLTMTGGIATGDINRDGLPDVFLVGGDLGQHKLYLNKGAGQFEDITASSGIELAGLMSNGASFADVTGDGLDDLLVGGVVKRATANNQGGAQTPVSYSLWKNLGNGQFADMTASSGLHFKRNLFSSAFADYDQDGDLDLATGHWHRMKNHQGEDEHLWENQGNGQFTAARQTMQIQGSWPEIDWSFTPNFADINNDGWPDLLYTSDFETSQYFINQQGKRFVNATDTRVITDENGMGSALADYDNDGDLDWFVTGVYDVSPKRIAMNTALWGGSGNRLYRNLGNGQFEDVTSEAGVRDGGWGWASCFADFNNDGHLDIFHVNGYLYDDHPAWLDMAAKFTHQAPRLFINDGRGHYSDQAQALGFSADEGRTISCTDFDRDGDVDILIQQLGRPSKLYMNQSIEQQLGQFIGVRIHGRAGEPLAGSRVYATTNGNTWMREIHIGSNYLSQNAAEAHIGLGDAQQLDELKIITPPPYARTIIRHNVAAGQWLDIQITDQ
ncbi:MAG: hypothetical protein CSA54_03375 [Gammaproteobacteria bacterium]|nr:MAG: hypothetical protein CSA54_03375 [Gammaproteobacteria bacterium]